MTDASDRAVGSVLQQQVENMWQPILYFSRKLTAPETRYSTFDRELLAVYLATKHFQYYVEGRKFTIFTDHKPLTYSIFCNPHRFSLRQVRHLEHISQFISDLRHVHGSDNPSADALSRIDIAAINQLPSPIDFVAMATDFVAMATAQRTDSELQKMRSSPASSLKLREIPLDNSDLKLWCDISTTQERPYVPPTFCRRIFEQLHGFSHLSYTTVAHFTLCLAQC